MYLGMHFYMAEFCLRLCLCLSCNHRIYLIFSKRRVFVYNAFSFCFSFPIYENKLTFLKKIKKKRWICLILSQDGAVFLATQNVHIFFLFMSKIYERILSRQKKRKFSENFNFFFLVAKRFIISQYIFLRKIEIFNFFRKIISLFHNFHVLKFLHTIFLRQKIPFLSQKTYFLRQKTHFLCQKPFSVRIF